MSKRGGPMPLGSHRDAFQPGGKDSDMLNITMPTGAASVPKAHSKKDAAAEERRRMVAWLDERVGAAQNEPQSEIVTLTPTLAALLLERNEANRPISEIALDGLSRDMAGGRWEFNGETIVISKDGKLNDGQHRCRAVVESGRPIRVVMVFGAERDSRMTLDTGIARTVGHFLGMHGYHDTTALGATANLIWQWRERGKIGANGRDMATKAEALLLMKHHADIPDSLNFVSRKGVTAICSKPLLAFAHWVIWHYAAGRPAADEFIDKLIDGTELKSGNPILYCRNRLIETKGAGRNSDKAELILRAWNMHRRGERAARIVVTGRQLPDLET